MGESTLFGSPRSLRPRAHLSRLWITNQPALCVHSYHPSFSFFFIISRTPGLESTLTFIVHGQPCGTSPPNALHCVPLAHQATFPGTSGIYNQCPTPTSCKNGWKDLGTFDTLAECQTAVNSTTLGFKPAAWTYQAKSVGGGYGTHCYASDSFATYTDPTPQANSIAGRGPGQFPGQKIDCANAAVDPNDRNHFIYSEGGSFNSYWESFDGGKTVTKNPNHDTGVYFVLIDSRGWMYTATQAGAFVTQDKGKTFNAYHAIMHTRENRTIDRVPHDFQNIVPEFRGDNVAFPSDQGLHIVNPNGSYTLINAIGDMHNTMSLSALISPSKDGKSRNIVSNIWDWDVAFSVDDGATWSGWQPGEQDPGSCGEGGSGESMGTSGYQVMFHHSHWYQSSDGGHNFVRGNTPGTPGGGFAYFRQANSRVEPAGTCFSLLSAPAPGTAAINDGKTVEEREHESHLREKKKLNNYAAGMASDEERAIANGDGNKVWLMVSEDYGSNYTWTVMPDNFQAGDLFTDPTDPTTLYGMTSNCIKTSKDKGKTWSAACMAGTGLTGRFSKLVIKDSKTMFMMRSGQVPLRTQDGGATWQPLTSTAPLFKYGATLDLSLSWSGKTVVIHGNDGSAIGRQEYGTYVWKSTDDGNTWTDETGDLVTISPGSGVWYEKDFYFVTRGEGICVKRNFEQ